MATKLDAIEKTTVDKRAIEELTKDTDSKIRELQRHISKQEDFTDDLRDIRVVKNKLSDLNSKMLAKTAFDSEKQELDNEIKNLQKQMSREFTLKKYKAELDNVKGQLEEIQKTKVGWTSFSSSNKKLDSKIQDRFREISDIKEIAEQFDAENVKLERFRKHLQASRNDMNKLQEDMQTLREESANTSYVEDTKADVMAALDKQKAEFEETTDEIDLSEFATQKQLEDLSNKIDSSSGSSGDNQEMKRIKEDISYLMSNTVSSQDLKNQLNEIKDKTRSSKSSKPSENGNGVLEGFKSGFVNFFSEDESEKVPEKKPKNEKSPDVLVFAGVVAIINSMRSAEGLH